jgi:hypothetical protein
MESKKINQLATELAPDLSDLTIIGDPTTGISKKITLSQMASLFTGTVEEYANFAAFPLVGTADTIYVAKDTNVLYRWNTGTSAYVELSPNIVSSLVFNDANGFDGTINLVGSVATLTITTALTTGSVGFIGASGALLQDNANFFWDDTNNRLGLGTNAPTTALDVFGSGIIGRLNGTSTNNAYLGFASAGTNKWSVGNVQSDHRFRIYNEATTSELVSVLQTGEFGIGIANPTTKIHIDGGASALIANLDANVSVAKSLSFRSDNSNRINLEVSGTESGSNAGANFFIRRYSDAGSLIDTPLTITRSTGAITLAAALSGTSAAFDTSITITKSQTGNGNTLTISNPSTTGALAASGMSLQSYNGTSTVDVLTLSATSNTWTYAGYGANAGVIYAGGTGGLDLMAGNASGSIKFFTAGDVAANERMNIASDGVTRFKFASDRGIRMKGAASSYAEIAAFQVFTENIRELRLTGSILQFYSGDGSNSTGAERGQITESGFLKARGAASTYVSLANSSHEISTNTNSNYTLFCSSQATTPYGLYIWYANASPNNSTTNEFLACTDTTNVRAYIYSNGNLANRNGTYGTISSDRRLKENIIPATSKLDDILKLNVVNFNFKDDTDKKKQLGFIAQEFKEVFPSLVYEKDTRKYDEEGNLTSGIEDSLGVQVGMEFAILVKAMQEQQTIIQELKTEIEILKAKIK